MTPRSIAHLLNPIATPADAELARGQRIAVRSMAIAAGVANREGRGVDLVTAQFPEDRFLPAPFRPTPDLDRSISNLGAFTHPRKLPLLADLLTRGFAASDAPVLVFTNADIGLRPDFYLRVLELFDSHLDACSITRRTIPTEQTDTEDPARLAELAETVGLAHPGHDCFVFRRELLEGVDLGDLCIGFPPFGRVLVALLSTFAPNGRFAVLEDTAWTFHLGDARSWCDDRYSDYWAHNQRAALAVLDAVDADRGLSPEAAEIRKSIEEQQTL